MIGDDKMKWAVIVLIILIVFSGCTNNSTNIADNNIVIHTAYDYVGKDDSFTAGDGLAAIIEIGDKKILFDTPYKDQTTELGESGFYSNMSLMNLEATDVDAVVITHTHGVNGLEKFLEKKVDATVFVTSDIETKYYERDFNISPVVIDGVTEIEKGVFLFPEQEGMAYGDLVQEQFLVLESEKGLIVLVGCLHQGLENVIQAVEDEFASKNIYMIYGGFHYKFENDEQVLNDKLDYLREHNVEAVAPCHCSGELFKQVSMEYEELEHIEVSAGVSVIID